jgi:hypothetical protein
MTSSSKPGRRTTWLMICAPRLIATGQWSEIEPQKVRLWVPCGILLGHIVSQQGIEPNSKKVSSLDRMGPI